MVQAVPIATTTPGRLVLPALCMGSFITTLTFAAPGPFLADMSRDLGVGVPLLGQVTAAMLILSAPLALVVGPVADRYGSKRFIVAGLAAAAVALFDFGLAPVFSLLFIASIAGSIAEATVPGLSLAIAGTRFAGPASRRAIGWTVGALASAPIVGVPILTTIGGLAGWRAAFLTAGFAAVGVVILVAIWLPDEPRATREPLRWGGLLDAYRPLLRDGGMRRLFACTLLRSLCWMGLLTYLGASLRHHLELTTSEIGLAYMLGGSGYFTGSIVAGGPLARLRARPLVAASNVTMAVLLLIVFAGVLNTPMTIVLCFLAAFAAAVGWVGLTALISGETPAGAGATMMLNSALFSIGAAAGAGLGGVLLSLGGFDAVAIGLPLFGLVSALLIWTPRSRAGHALPETVA